MRDGLEQDRSRSHHAASSPESAGGRIAANTTHCRPNRDGKSQPGTSALSNLRFGVRPQFVSEVGVIGLFQNIAQLSTPLPRNASCSLRVSLRTPAPVPVGEGRVRGVRENAWASGRKGVTKRREHESPSPRPSPAGQRRSFVVIDDCLARTVRGRGGKRPSGGTPNLRLDDALVAPPASDPEAR